MSYDPFEKINRESARAWCGTHECAVPGCPELISDKLLMCEEHRKQVPEPLEHAVWQTWRAVKRDGSTANWKAYDAACAAAIRSVTEVKP